MDKRLERIKEIEKTRRALAYERDELEREINLERNSKVNTERQSFVGKYFKLKQFEKSQSYPAVIAFKIISLNDKESNEIKEARCLSIISGRGKAIWEEYGVLNMMMHLWSYDKLAMMMKADSPKVIDKFKEITEEEFYEIYNNTLKDIEKHS